MTETANYFGLMGLVHQLEQPEPISYLSLFYSTIGCADFALLIPMIGFVYFVGCSAKYCSATILTYILIKNTAAEGTIYIQELCTAFKGTPLESVLDGYMALASNELGAVTLAILSGILMGKAASVVITFIMAVAYMAYFSNIVKDTAQTLTFNILFFIAVTIPVIVLFIVYKYVDTIFTALFNGAISTFFIVWFIDRNLDLLKTGENETAKLCRNLSDMKVFELNVLIFVLGVLLSMLSQVILYEPTIKVYYIVKEKYYDTRHREEPVKFDSHSDAKSDSSVSGPENTEDCGFVTFK